MRECECVHMCTSGECIHSVYYTHSHDRTEQPAEMKPNEMKQKENRTEKCGGNNEENPWKCSLKKTNKN